MSTDKFQEHQKLTSPEQLISAVKVRVNILTRTDLTKAGYKLLFESELWVVYTRDDVKSIATCSVNSDSTLSAIILNEFSFINIAN